MTSVPYRPKSLNPVNIFSSSSPKTTSKSIDVTDNTLFPSLTSSDVKREATWQFKNTDGKTEEDNEKGGPPFINPGWLYIDGFERKDGNPLMIYGGPSTNIIYKDDYRVEREMAVRHRKHKREMDELNDVLGNIAPLGLQLREAEREAWLINDVIEELNGDSEDSDNCENIDSFLETGEDGYI